jgi:glycosidase
MPSSINGPEVRAAFDSARVPRANRITVAGKSVDVPTPFPSPEDWRDQWIYFLLVDRFNNPNRPPNNAPFDGMHGVFQGGTLNGVRERLDYLKELGVGAIWLSPVQKNCQYNPFTYHGYGIQDFLEIDPRFASDPAAAKANPRLVDDELRALVDEAHARGIYVIFDIVLNHAGDVFEYVLDDGRRAGEADFRDGGYVINWRDENGRGRPDWTEAPADPPRDAAIWPTELRRNAAFRRKGKGGEAGGDFSSLKEMVTDLQEIDAASGRHFPVRNALISAYQYLIAKFDVDGFRIDTLKYIEPEFAQIFGNSMREFALAIGKKNFFTFGEVYDNEEQIARFIGRQATEQGDLVGVDAALDFPLFFKLPGVAKGRTPPAEVVQIFEHRKSWSAA